MGLKQESKQAPGRGEGRCGAMRRPARHAGVRAQCWREAGERGSLAGVWSEIDPPLPVSVAWCPEQATVTAPHSPHPFPTPPQILSHPPHPPSPVVVFFPGGIRAPFHRVPFPWRRRGRAGETQSLRRGGHVRGFSSTGTRDGREARALIPEP